MEREFDGTVIIVNYKTADLTLQCLKSLYENIPGKYTLEIIVVDNASNDGSVERISLEYPNATIINNSKNLGFARANNLAMKSGRGKYFLLLNSDTIVFPGVIEKSIEHMNENKHVGILGCRLLNLDRTHQHSAARLPTFKTIFYEHVLGIMASWYPEEECTRTLKVGSVSGAYMMVSRAATEKVGLFDESYFMNVEDVDWCKRMWDNGFEVNYCGDVSIIHLGGQSIKINPDIRWENRKNLLKYFNKHGGHLSSIVVFCIFIVGFLVYPLKYVLAGVFGKTKNIGRYKGT
jgi:GT2 family glycosyltransferase